MKYLLQAIEARREAVQLSDGELRKLLVEVRSGKDDRIEFIEAMTRLLEELRSSEHATAFLTKVAKRDAPDYYEVIKNPMDLGTMLRNVKSGRYKSKAQFMRDLDLIWDNCLTYNSEPTHPLRRSVQLLRGKANHLLTYVNDTNDVKEALSQWQASSTSTTNTRSGSALHVGSPWADSAVHPNGSNKGSLLSNGRSMSMSLQRVHATLVDAPFEQKPAVLRSVQGMGTFASLDQSLSRADEHFEKTYMSLNDASTEAGPSHRPDITLDSEPNGVNGLAATASGDMLRTLESSSLGGVLRSALTMGPVDAGEASGNNGTMTRNTSANGSAVMQGKQRENERVPYPLELQESLDDVVGSDFQLGAWWNSTTSSNLLASGISSLSTSVQIEPISKRSIGEASRKKRRKRKGDMPSHVFGGVEALERNVSTISKLRRTHTKFGALASHIENEEPIPAALAVVSSDESDNEDASRRGTAEKEPELRTRKRYKEVDMCAPSMHDPFRNPYAKLSSEGATEILESKTQFLLAHAGFEGVQRAAIDVITDVASEYIMSIGRTLRMYTDQFAHEMSVEEIILHAIFENGGMDIRSLESYIVDDVLRYGSKMSDLLRKLQASYRETLSSTNLTMEDEAYFAENAEGNNDQIMSGTFAQDMGDDFFGFKEMGLDKELGLDMSQLVVPSKLFDRGKNARGSNGRHVGAVARSGAAASNGVIGGPAEVILFEPPPPYVPLSEAAISAQIGLLQPFYRDLIRSRGQWQHRSNRRRDDSGEGEGDDEAEAEVEEAEVKEGVDEEGRRSTSNRSILILPDEEMERQRYKVPPNGKMPKRAMKSKGDYKLTSSKKDAASTTASTTTKTTSKSSSSKKKKKVD